MPKPPSPSGEGSGVGAAGSHDRGKPHPNPSPGSEAVAKEQREGLDRLITLAAIIGAHGVAGEVRLKLLGEGLDALAPHQSFNAGALTLTKLRDDGKGGAIARFAGVADRAAAERLRGIALTVPRAALPPLEEGEFYHADLIGLAVVSDAGEPVGRVCAIENFGATDILEIEKPDGGKFMVPLTPQAVPEWDRARVVVSQDFIG